MAKKKIVISKVSARLVCEIENIVDLKPDKSSLWLIPF